MKKILVISLISVLLISLSLLVFASNTWSKDQMVEQIRVIGNDILAKEEIIDLTDSLCFKSEFTKEDFLEIESALLENSFIQEAEIYKNANKIVLEITERKPVAYFLKQGQVKLISNDLKILPMREDLANYNFPVLRLESGKLDESKESLTSIFSQIQSNEDLNLLLSEIIFNGETGEINLVLNQNSIIVKLGRGRTLEEKFKKFNEFWYKVALKEGLDFKIIDLRWDKKILVS